MWIFKSITITYGLSLCLLFVYCGGPKNSNKAIKFETILKDVRECPNPVPSYTHIRTMFSISEIRANRIMKGNVTLKDSVPFRNFSGRTYSVDSAGQKELKFQISQVNCRHFIAKTILQFVNINYNKKNCLLAKGVYSYVIDMNKMTHSLPTWHDEGGSIHELQMVANGETTICNEVVVVNQLIK